MNIKELKEIIKDLPDDMPVENCCGGKDTAARVLSDYDWDIDDGKTEYDYLWIGVA